MSDSKKIDKETEELIKKIKQDTIMYVDEERYTWIVPRFFYPQPNLPISRLLTIEDLKK